MATFKEESWHKKLGGKEGRSEDLGTKFGELEGDLSSDPSAASGHDGDIPLEKVRCKHEKNGQLPRYPATEIIYCLSTKNY